MPGLILVPGEYDGHPRGPGRGDRRGRGRLADIGQRRAARLLQDAIGMAEAVLHINDEKGINISERHGHSLMLGANSLSLSLLIATGLRHG